MSKEEGDISVIHLREVSHRLGLVTEERRKIPLNRGDVRKLRRLGYRLITKKGLGKQRIKSKNIAIALREHPPVSELLAEQIFV
jgi:hypothetical protein